MLSEHTFLNCCPVNASDAMWRIYRRIWQVAAAASAASLAFGQDPGGAFKTGATAIAQGHAPGRARWKSVAPSLALSPRHGLRYQLF
jgi:hypothetical protein